MWKLLESKGQRLGVPLNILQFRTVPQRSYPAQNANSVEAEKLELTKVWSVVNIQIERMPPSSQDLPEMYYEPVFFA